MRKIVLGVMVATLALALGTSTGFAAKKPKYKEGDAGAGSISGTVSLKGAAMAPIVEDLTKGKNVEFCSTHPDAKDGKRNRVKVTAAGGKLKDAVVFIENIETGKKWSTDPINFDFKTCDIFPKVSIVRKTPKGMKKGLVTITNQDPEVLHNPHGYSVKGANRKTLFNKPLPSQGDVADVTKNMKRFKQKKDKHFFLQCDQHNFMEADGRIVWNPYYSISGADGAFKIDGEDRYCMPMVDISSGEHFSKVDPETKRVRDYINEKCDLFRRHVGYRRWPGQNNHVTLEGCQFLCWYASCFF